MELAWRPPASPWLQTVPHMGEGKDAALGKHLGFLGEDIQVEPEPVSGEEDVAVRDTVFQVADQFDGFFSAHPVCGMMTVRPAVPKDRLVAVAQEGCRARDPQRAARPPVGFVLGYDFRRFDVETEIVASCVHALIIGAKHEFFFPKKN
jgi:hypothetical protein